MLQLTTIDVQGTPQELGRAQGLALSSLIQRFIPMRLAAAEDYMAEVGGGGVPDLLAAGRACYALFQQWDPEAAAEHDAMAAAAGVDAKALFTAGNMTDIRDVVLLGDGGWRPADPEGCSAVLMPREWTKDGEILVGQTWDLNPQDLDYVVAIRRRPTAGPQTWSVTVAGAPSLIGMNEHGLCVGTTNIKTRGGRTGVGYLNVLHRALNQTTFAAGAEVIEGAPRAGAHVFWLADEHRFVEWETTPDAWTRRSSEEGPVARTNHCLSPGAAAVEGEAASASSLARIARIDGWLQTRGRTMDNLQALFCSRHDGVNSINRYPEDDQGTATNSVVLFQPARRSLMACRGPADQGAWQRLHFGPEQATTPAE